MRACRGFSLMEVMVAMVLLAAVGGVVMRSFTSSVQVTSPDTGVAYNFGRGVLEQFHERVRADQWASPANPLALLPGGRPAIPSNPKTLNGNTYTASYTVSGDTGLAIDTNGDGEEDYRRVVLAVSWP
jgi:prepilin-type N-terminal cleavage/methylation domain-containing protein